MKQPFDCYLQICYDLAMLLINKCNIKKIQNKITIYLQKKLQGLDITTIISVISCTTKFQAGNWVSRIGINLPIGGSLTCMCNRFNATLFYAKNSTSWQNLEKNSA